MKQNLLKLGERLLEAREARNLTQDDVFELTGIRKGNISAYENDTSYPGSETLFKLSELYGVSTDWILKGKNPGQAQISEDDLFYNLEHLLQVPNKELTNLFKAIISSWEKGDEELKGWIMTQLRIELVEKLKTMKKKKKE